MKTRRVSIKQYLMTSGSSHAYYWAGSLARAKVQKERDEVSEIIVK